MRYESLCMTGKNAFRDWRKVIEIASGKFYYRIPAGISI